MKQLQIYCIWKVIKEGSWPQTFEPCPILCHISVKLGIYLALCVRQIAKIRLIALRFSKILHSMKILWYFESLWLPPCKKTIQVSGIKVDWRPMDTHFSIRSWGIYFWVSVSDFCTLLDQIVQALRAQLTCNLHTWLVGINNDTAKMNPDLAILCNWKTSQLWNCLDYFKTEKNSAQLCYFIIYRSRASPTGMLLINSFHTCLNSISSSVYEDLSTVFHRQQMHWWPNISTGIN